MGIDLATRLLFPTMKGMSLEITEERIARQTPEAQAIIRALLAKIKELQDQLNQSPRNSSVPPNTEHPTPSRPDPRPVPCAVGVVSPATPGMSVRSSRVAEG